MKNIIGLKKISFKSTILILPIFIFTIISIIFNNKELVSSLRLKLY